MTTETAPFGLLLDVDGPIANPETRTMSNTAMARTLADLANANIPIAFNTGRGAYFLDTIVLPNMVEAGLDSNILMLAATEKGGIISKVFDGKCADPSFAPGLRMPDGFAAFARNLVETEYPNAIWYDEHKDIMVSLESYTGLDKTTFRSTQQSMDDHIAAWFEAHNFGYQRSNNSVPDNHGQIQFRIDEHIIGTDVEPVEFSKALGAQRIIDAFKANGVPVPHRWYTVGDSRSDYTMATWLHEHGYEAIHVDVRPAEGIPATPYPVITVNNLVNDAAGEAFLAAALKASTSDAAPQAGSNLTEHLASS